MTFLVLVLLSLGAYRLQRVVTTDDWPLSEWFRSKVERRFGSQSSWYTLLTCPWCLGFWVSGATVFVVDRWFHAAPMPILVWLAVSTVVGLIGEWESRG